MNIGKGRKRYRPQIEKEFDRQVKQTRRRWQPKANPPSRKSKKTSTETPQKKEKTPHLQSIQTSKLLIPPFPSPSLFHYSHSYPQHAKSPPPTNRPTNQPTRHQFRTDQDVAMRNLTADWPTSRAPDEFIPHAGEGAVAAGPLLEESGALGVVLGFALQAFEAGVAAGGGLCEGTRG